MNYRLISKILGSLLVLESLFMLICLGVSVWYRESDLLPFTVSIVITMVAAVVLHYVGRKTDSLMSRREAFLVVTLSWSVFSLFGSLPFMLGGYITNFTNAYFETISGFTTTGASILDDVECLPHGILFWRSLTQWVGGLGIVFFTIAILPSLVAGSVKVFAAEATGPIKAKMHPRLTTTAKWIWSIYLLLTIGCGVSFWAVGMNWYEALNYSMTTTATGGFSIHNDGTNFFNSPEIDYISILFQFLAGIHFTLLYVSIFKTRLTHLFRDSEFKLYITVVAIATMVFMSTLILQMCYDYERAFRESLYQVVSFMTTTGVYNADVAQWPHLTWIIIGCVMLLGACAGSTSGGFKCIRGVMLLKVVRNNFLQSLHPNAVLPVRINGQNVPRARLIALSAFFVLVVMMLLVTTTIMILSGIDSVNSIIIALSCVSNVGPSLANDIGANITWSGMADHIKWVLCLLMLMGRLEIMTVLVLFTRSFWKEN